MESNQGWITLSGGQSGTSLEVGSAAQFAHMYHGRDLEIINKGKTKMEGKADLVFHNKIGEIFEQVMEQ